MATEDFTTYTEVDPNTRITITSSKVTWAGLTRNEDAYTYNNKGVDYFAGNFEIQFTVEITALVASNRIHLFSLANLVDDAKGIRDASGDLLGVTFETGSTSIARIRHIETDGGSDFTDGGGLIVTANTIYYITFRRDESVGTYGTRYLDIYSDVDRTTSLHSDSRALNTSKKDFRYIYAPQTWNGSSPEACSGYVENLDVVFNVNSTTAPSVTIQATTDVTGTTATGNGNVGSLGSPLATQHGHCWATHTNPTTNDSKTELGVPSSTGAYTSNLTGLIQNVVYYMRSYIINSLGTFYSSQLASFNTTVGLPVVVTFPVTSIAVTTAQGNGILTNTGGTPVTQHGMVWDKSNQADPDVDVDTGSGFYGKTEEGTNDDLGIFFSAMTGLTANTEYKMRAYAINDTGTGYGTVLTFTTDTAGTPIVTTEAMSNVQTTFATGNGTLVDVGGSAVTEHGHVWKVITDPHTSPITSDSKKANTDSISAGTSFTSLVSVLTEGTGYVIRSYAINAQGTAYGNDVFINRGTDADPSTAIFGLFRGELTILGKHIAYTDEFGDQRGLLGTPLKE